MNALAQNIDSASYVIDLITSNGAPETPKLQRIFWAFTEGAVATVLLAVGGDTALNALQTVSIASAFPLCFILIIMIYGLVKAFDMDKELLSMNGLAEHKKSDDLHQDNSGMGDIPETTVYTEANAEDDDELKEWKVDFFEGLFESAAAFAMSTLIPCWLQYKNGKKVGIYGKGNVCTEISWIIAVFGAPMLFVVLHVCEIWVEGLAYLAWVVYVFFVFVGMFHRVQIREHYHLNGSAVLDLTSYCCCYCFAVSQESLQCDTILL